MVSGQKVCEQPLGGGVGVGRTPNSRHRPSRKGFCMSEGEPHRAPCAGDCGTTVDVSFAWYSLRRLGATPHPGRRQPHCPAQAHTGRFMCETCMSKERRGCAASQMELGGGADKHWLTDKPGGEIRARAEVVTKQPQRTWGRCEERYEKEAVISSPRPGEH